MDWLDLAGAKERELNYTRNRNNNKNNMLSKSAPLGNKKGNLFGRES